MFCHQERCSETILCGKTIDHFSLAGKEAVLRKQRSIRIQEIRQSLSLIEMRSLSCVVRYFASIVGLVSSRAEASDNVAYKRNKHTRWCVVLK